MVTVAKFSISDQKYYFKKKSTQFQPKIMKTGSFFEKLKQKIKSFSSKIVIVSKPNENLGLELKILRMIGTPLT